MPINPNSAADDEVALKVMQARLAALTLKAVTVIDGLGLSKEQDDALSDLFDDISEIFEEEARRVRAAFSPVAQTLITHIRPAQEADPICYAWQVCASSDTGAVPVYGAEPFIFAQTPTPVSHVAGPSFTDWERSQMLQIASANALTYMSHHANGGLRSNEIEEMERWKALSDKLRSPEPTALATTEGRDNV